jgi:hypothetical protein
VWDIAWSSFAQATLSSELRQPPRPPAPPPAVVAADDSGGAGGEDGRGFGPEATAVTRVVGGVGGVDGLDGDASLPVPEPSPPQPNARRQAKTGNPRVTIRLLVPV